MTTVDVTTVDAAVTGGAVQRRAPADVPLARRPATRGARARAGVRTRRRRFLATMATMAAAAAVGAGVVVHLDVARDTDAAVIDLARTRAAVAAAADAERATQDELLATGLARVAAGASLDGGIEALRAAAAEAAITIAQRDEALAALAMAEGELGAATGSLTAAGAERAARAARIAQLQSCLTGVNRALTLTAFNDHRGAVRALADVSPTCDAARVAP